MSLRRGYNLYRTKQIHISLRRGISKYKTKQTVRTLITFCLSVIRKSLRSLSTSFDGGFCLSEQERLRDCERKGWNGISWFQVPCNTSIPCKSYINTNKREFYLILLATNSLNFSINPKRIYGSEVKLQEQKQLKITTLSTPKTLIEIRKQSRRCFCRNPEIDKTVPKSEDFSHSAADNHHMGIVGEPRGERNMFLEIRV